MSDHNKMFELTARAEAAEARCAELEGSSESAFRLGKLEAAEDMRERIATYLDAEADKLTAEFYNHSTAKCRAESYRIAARNIRAIPIEAETPHHPYEGQEDIG